MVNLDRANIDRDMGFRMSNVALSTIGIGAIFHKIKIYLKDMNECLDALNNTKGDDVRILYIISKIRERTTDVHYNTELLRRTIERLLTEQEDVKINKTPVSKHVDLSEDIVKMKTVVIKNDKISNDKDDK